MICKLRKASFWFVLSGQQLLMQFIPPKALTRERQTTHDTGSRPEAGTVIRERRREMLLQLHVIVILTALHDMRESSTPARLPLGITVPFPPATYSGQLFEIVSAVGPYRGLECHLTHLKWIQGAAAEVIEREGGLCQEASPFFRATRTEGPLLGPWRGGPVMPTH